MSAILVEKFPREHNNAHQDKYTAKVTISRGSGYISEQMLVADIQYRLKGIDVFGIYQTGRNYVWFVEFNREEDMRSFIKVPGISGEKYTANSVSDVGTKHQGKNTLAANPCEGSICTPIYVKIW